MVSGYSENNHLRTAVELCEIDFLLKKLLIDLIWLVLWWLVIWEVLTLMW